jgi:hypothetical protein
MLNLSSSSGGGNYIRFMPSANAWLNSNKEEFTPKKMVVDTASLQTGWMHLGEGVRDWQPDASLGKKGAQPSPDHKRGFSIKFYNKEMGLAEWSANGTGPNMGLEKLWKAIEAGQAANSDKLPVIEYKGSTLEKIGKGTTRIPNFDVVSWIDRPAGMDAVDDGTQSFDSDGKISMAAPAPVAQPKPVQKTAMAQAVEDDEMF